MINTVCLTGSTKYLDEYHIANVELTKLGLSVITISMAMPKEQPTEEDRSLKELLDLVHFNKILRADAVLIVHSSYIGFSTAREIIWADMQGKPIIESDRHGYVPSWGQVTHAIKNGVWYPAIVNRAHDVLKGKKNGPQ